MPSFDHLIRQNPLFFGLFAAYLILGAGLLLLFPKGDIELWINAHHTPAADYFFKYWTELGSGTIFVLPFLFYLFQPQQRRLAILTAAIFVLQGASVQALKTTIFEGQMRPKVVLAPTHDLHFVEGVEVYSKHSFPSGHTAAAFALATMLSLQLPNIYWTLLFFTTAFLVGLSRIYLVQHFFVDTYFGALLGVVMALFGFMFFYGKIAGKHRP